MEELIAAVNIHTLGMAQILGYSQDQVFRDCTIREFLLYLAMLPTPAESQAVAQAVAHGEVPAQDADSFIAEVKREFRGN